MHMFTNLLVCLTLIQRMPKLAAMSCQELCIERIKIDCSQLAVDTVCDTKGNSYLNFCDFDQAHCRDNTLAIDYTKSCLSGHATHPTTNRPKASPTPITSTSVKSTTQTPIPTNPTTTKSPASTTDNFQDLVNLFCQNKDILSCMGENKVCGSDGVTYANACEFTKKQCDNKNLKIVHNGEC